MKPYITAERGTASHRGIIAQTKESAGLLEKKGRSRATGLGLGSTGYNFPVCNRLLVRKCHRAKHIKVLKSMGTGCSRCF